MSGRRGVVGSGDEGTQAALAEFSQGPVLSRNEEIGLAREIETANLDFRRAFLSIPRVAEEIVKVWQQREREQRSTRRLSESSGSRGGAGRKAGQQFDRSLKRAEALLGRSAEQRSGRSVNDKRLEIINRRIARELQNADLSLRFLGEIRQRMLTFQESLEGVVRERARLDEPRHRPRSEAGWRRRRRALRQLAARRRALESEVGMTAWALLQTAERMESAWHRLVQARNRLVRHNLRLVFKLARFYAANSPIPLTDLIQEGSIGLVRAVEKFDRRRGFKFSTYAVWWIRQSLVRAIQKDSRTIRLPAHVHESLRKYKRAEAALESERGVDPSRDEVLERAGLATEQAKRLAQIPAEPLSLEAELSGLDSSTLGDVVADPRATGQAEALDHCRLKQLTSKALSRLPKRERQLLRWRYGLAGQREHTLEAIGQKLNLSRERVRQLEEKALEGLKCGPDGEEILQILYS